MKEDLDNICEWCGANLEKNEPHSEIAHYLNR